MYLFFMLWTEVIIHTTTEGIEPVSGILLMNGINGYAVEDSEDFKSFLDNKEVYFDYVEDDLLKLRNCETTVTYYVPNNAQGAEIFGAVKRDIERLKQSDKDGVFGSLKITGDKNIEEQDWENNWKKYFKPFPVGEKLCIKPSWEELPDSLSDKIILEIDPSSSFGTGSHTTTRLCLEAIEKSINKVGSEKKVLDMGCGSGILGIAASKMGSSHITAVDIDENSARIAGENFVMNNIDKSKYDVFAGNILEDADFYNKICAEKYDLIAANIVADIIMAMSTMFKSILKKNGLLLVSGIIAERSKEVVDELLSEGFEVVEFTESEGWAAVTLCHGSL